MTTPKPGVTLGSTKQTGQEAKTMVITAALLIALLVTVADMAEWATQAQAEPAEPVQAAQAVPAEPVQAAQAVPTIRQLKASAKAIIGQHGSTPAPLVGYGRMNKARLMEALAQV